MIERSRPFVRIVLLFLVVRILLGAWMWGVRQLIPGNPPTITANLYMGVPVEANPWLEPWQRWDTPQYQAIASHGYSAFDTALFSPPLYPLFMGALASLFRGDTLASGLFISGLAFLGCLIAVFQIGRIEFKDEGLGFRSAVYMAIFPTAFFLSAAYNESLFLAGALFCLYFARRKRWVSAGACGAFASLSRITGPLLVIPLIFAAWEATRNRDRYAWLAPTITAAGAAIFPLYVWFGLHESPLAILAASTRRGGTLTIPGTNIVEAAIRIFRGELITENLIELLFTVAFIVLTIIIWRKLPRIYGIFSASLMMFFLCRLGNPQPLVSMGRYVLEIFPAFIVLAMWSRNAWINRLLVILSVFGLLFFSAQFAVWGWVG